jgi:hypothetical protein
MKKKLLIPAGAVRAAKKDAVIAFKKILDDDTPFILVTPDISWAGGQFNSFEDLERIVWASVKIAEIKKVCMREL